MDKYQLDININKMDQALKEGRNLEAMKLADEVDWHTDSCLCRWSSSTATYMGRTDCPILTASLLIIYIVTSSSTH